MLNIEEPASVVLRRERLATTSDKEHLDLVVRDVERHLERDRRSMAEVVRAIPFDRSDLVEFRVPSEGGEIQVRHPLNRMAPTDWIITYRSGPGLLWPSRKELADERAAYFATDAAPGTIFRVLFGRL